MYDNILHVCRRKRLLKTIKRIKGGKKIEYLHCTRVFAVHGINAGVCYTYPFAPLNAVNIMCIDKHKTNSKTVCVSLFVLANKKNKQTNKQTK